MTLAALTPSRGTLVLILPTMEGLVACADRREWNRIEGPRDTADKIFELNHDTAFVVSGSTVLSVSEGGDLKRVYTLAGSVKEFYAHRSFRDREAEWMELAAFLKKQFENAYARYHAAIEVTPGASDDVIWEVDFMFPSNRAPIVKQVLYRLDGTVTQAYLPIRPYIAGETAVSLRILRPQQFPGFPDPRFSDLYALDQIARVWNFSAPTYPGNVTVEDALVFSHTFIRASSERMALLQDGPNLVGPTCDCMLMKKRTGFQWLQRNVDTRNSGLSLPH